MSFDVLPNELHDEVAEYLTAAECLNLKCTSKFQCGRAGMGLNEKIHIYKSSAQALSKLVYKLLFDPRLAARIKTVTLLEDTDQRPAEIAFLFRPARDAFLLLIDNDVEVTPTSKETVWRQFSHSYFKSSLGEYAHASTLDGSVVHMEWMRGILRAEWDFMVGFVLGVAYEVKDIRLRLTEAGPLTQLFLCADGPNTPKLKHLHPCLGSIKHFEVEFAGSNLRYSAPGVHYEIPWIRQNVLPIPAQDSLQTLKCTNVSSEYLHPFRMAKLKFMEMSNTSWGRRYRDLDSNAQSIARLESVTVYENDPIAFNLRQLANLSDGLSEARNLRFLDLQVSFIYEREYLHRGIVSLVRFGKLQTLRLSMQIFFSRPALPANLQDTLPRSIIEVEVYVRNNQPLWKHIREAMKMARECYDAGKYPHLNSITMIFVDKYEGSEAFVQMEKDLRLILKDWGSRIDFKAIRRVTGQTDEVDILEEYRAILQTN
ncbi:uncharacterized protein BDZ99DRAFT_187502 [Mytilinidion resinicola]|uniref:F-box domain-containing protein n=1 Tax=Mytilinidion resinicola TaxID=574789 RepID=A0A6A6Z3V4_9PEZI|nr:uncharacterized protein BDZ99DRAFT_187502 [Mytilinidion resinicola]KAF2814937.1 hypothetical protein BDZ99DRAFT_187502 [Mytilinidion resinicola]